jgi:5-methylthioadenosine/S-adenosylhomocysteine deaminase
MNREWKIYENGFVAIRDGRIVEVGDATLLGTRSYRPAEAIDARGKVVLPGLVNSHTHIPMVLFRGLADDLKVEDWLNDYIFPVESTIVTREFTVVGTRLALAEMVRGGVSTFCDMYYFEDAVAEETSKAGVRGVLGETVVDFPAPDNKTWEAALAYVEEFAAKWKDDPLIVPAIAPHAPYTVGAEHLRQAHKLADRLDIPVMMHIAEAPSETDYTLRHFGARPVAYLERIGFLSGRLIAVHLIQVNDDEIEYLKKHDVGVAHCPQSNMKVAVGVAPIPQMLRSGLRVGLGTDGAASNNDLNLWEEMDTAAKLHKVITGDPTVVSARQALAMGTIGGAQAIHMDDEIGSLEVGKYADLILVDLDTFHLVPKYDIYSHLVYAAKASDVTDTIVNGRVLMRNRRLLTIDAQEAKAAARRYGRQVNESLNLGNR